MDPIEYHFKSGTQKAEFLRIVTQNYPFIRTTKNECGYILSGGDASDGYNERVIAVVRKKSILLDGFETSEEAKRANTCARLNLTNLCTKQLG